MDDFCDKLFGTLDYFPYLCNQITKNNRIMKRICVLLISSFIALTVSAQKSVTKFLGIPVDGFKSEMKILEESQLSAEFDNNDLPF